MANIRSAKKRARQAEGRQRRNRSARTGLRTVVKKYLEAEGAEKGKLLPATHSEIDRAWKKGVIHRNAAARYKSRLSKRATPKKS
jgi:small subunit ribosomal protein S20